MTVHPRDHMSDAVEAPFNSMTSGATTGVATSGNPDLSSIMILTPIRSTSYIILDILHGVQIKGYSEIRKLNIPVFRCQDVSCLEIAMHNLTIGNNWS